MYNKNSKNNRKQTEKFNPVNFAKIFDRCSASDTYVNCELQELFDINPKIKEIFTDLNVDFTQVTMKEVRDYMLDEYMNHLPNMTLLDDNSFWSFQNSSTSCFIKTGYGFKFGFYWVPAKGRKGYEIVEVKYTAFTAAADPRITNQYDTMRDPEAYGWEIR